MEKPVEKKNNHKFVNVVNGQEEEYDICISVRFAQENRIKHEDIYTDFFYLGKGFVSEVDGTVYNGKELCHFWKFQ